MPFADIVPTFTIIGFSALPPLLLPLPATTLKEAYLPVAVMLVVAVGFAIGNMILGALLGKKKYNIVKGEPYECGVPAIGSARAQVFVRFYLVALLFVLFDMEVVYILAWALATRQHGGVPGFMGFGMLLMATFLVILTVGLIYEWKKGALKWN